MLFVLTSSNSSNPKEAKKQTSRQHFKCVRHDSREAEMEAVKVVVDGEKGEIPQ